MQKLIPVVTFLFIFSSCSNHSKNDLVVFNATEEGLSNSNKRITSQTDFLYKSLQNKLAEPRTHEQAAIWQPKAEYIKQLSSDMTNYIENLKNDLIKEAGFKKENDKEEYREDDMGAVTRIFTEKKHGKELYGKLVKYKEAMLTVDEGIKNEFGNNAVLVTRAFDVTTNQQENFTQTFFTDVPLIAALGMLDKIENNVKIMENDFVMYCYYRIADDFRGYERFSPIIGQSSSYLRGGEEIEIIAGIGAFTTAANPRITINRKIIDLHDDAVATYKFKTPLKAGKYFVSIQIQYTKPDGTEETMVKNLPYTVAE